MTLDSNSGQQRHDNGSSRFSAGFHDLHLQCQRILRCTANALASSPGGLRFKAGTRPWLEGLTQARPVLMTGLGRKPQTVLTCSD